MTIFNRLTGLLVSLLLITSCASTGLGKGVQAGEVSKIFVDGAMDQIVMLYCVDGRTYANCTPRISKDKYDIAVDSYNKAAAVHKTYADALLTWDRVKNVANDLKVQAAAKDLRLSLDNAANILCSFKNLSANLQSGCATVGR